MKKNQISILKNIGITALILILSTLLGVAFKNWNLHDTNVVVLYIFSVLLISLFTHGYLYGICASVIALLLFNWFFTEPYFTLKVNDMTYIITFAIMTLISVVTSALTTKIKQIATDAKERENESNALYQMTNHLTDAEDEDNIAEITIKTASDVLGCNTSCICFNEKGIPQNTFLQSKEDGSIIRRELTNGEEIKKRLESLHGGIDITDQEYRYPIYGKSYMLAILCIPSAVASNMQASQTRMLHSIIESASLAMERLRSLHAQAKSREEATHERYRGNLLRSISHDIRTPLSGIMGTSEMLMGKTDKKDARYALAKDIYEDAEWLHGFVENILNLTKLQDGKLILHKQLEAVEEVISAALMVMEKRIPDRVIDVEIPDNVVIAPMDAKLISQVLINLLDNANKHTPKEGKITITVLSDERWVSVCVADEGNGIPEKDIPHVFQMFYTAGNKSPDAKRGVGLGLAICQSIVEAHGGSITAKNQSSGGACFTFTLPVGGEN